MTCCPSDALCPMHLEDRWMQLRGVAASRAHQWLLELRASGWRGTWRTERALEIARRRVEDLARDEGLLRRLTAECARCAEEEWRDLQ